MLPELRDPVVSGGMVQMELGAPVGVELRRVRLGDRLLLFLQEDGPHVPAGVPPELGLHRIQGRARTGTAPAADHSQTLPFDDEERFLVSVGIDQLRRDPDLRDHLGPSLDVVEDRLRTVLLGEPHAAREHPALPAVHPGRDVDIHRGRPHAQEPVQGPAVVRIPLGYRHGVDGLRVDLQVLHVVLEVPVPQARVEQHPLTFGLHEHREPLGAYQGRVDHRPLVVYALDPCHLIVSRTATPVCPRRSCGCSPRAPRRWRATP